MEEAPRTGWGLLCAVPPGLLSACWFGRRAMEAKAGPELLQAVDYRRCKSCRTENASAVSLGFRPVSLSFVCICMRG